jgi:hypothetical protein
VLAIKDEGIFDIPSSGSDFALVSHVDGHTGWLASFCQLNLMTRSIRPAAAVVPGERRNRSEVRARRRAS